MKLLAQIVASYALISLGAGVALMVFDSVFDHDQHWIERAIAFTYLPPLLFGVVAVLSMLLLSVWGVAE